MADERPAPLVPADVNLRAYPFMPFYGETLRTSGFNARATADEFRAAVNLWWSAWWQVPAGSLPNNELELARLADVRDLRRWRKVRAVAMEKWVLSSDDRWYHPFLRDIVLSSWERSRNTSARATIAARKRWKNNGLADAASIATSSAASITRNASSIAPSTKSDAPSNANRSEVNTPLTPQAKSTSKPTPATPSIAKAQAALAAADHAKRSATPPPGGLSPSEFLKTHTKPKPTPAAFEDLEA